MGSFQQKEGSAKNDLNSKPCKISQIANFPEALWKNNIGGGGLLDEAASQCPHPTIPTFNESARGLLL